MLYFLDAGVNVKGAPNENFAREIMELFTMGVGHYARERHPRGGARVHRLERRRPDLRGPRRAARRRAQDLSRADRQLRRRRASSTSSSPSRRPPSSSRPSSTASSSARSSTPGAAGEARGRPPRRRLRDRSRCCGRSSCRGTSTARPRSAPTSRARSQLVVSTYRKLGATAIPGIPDFNEATEAMGQALFWPPTVAGWAGRGGAGSRPGCCSSAAISRWSVLFPDIDFVAARPLCARPDDPRRAPADPAGPRHHQRDHAGREGRRRRRWPNSTCWPTATRTSTPATAPIAAGRWRSPGSSRSRARAVQVDLAAMVRAAG